METFSALLAISAGNSPVPGEFPAQRPVRQSFDVFFDLRPNKRLSKQWWGWWFETLPSPLWRHCNVLSCTQSNRVNQYHSCDLGQGHEEIIQYIYPDLYFLYPKYLRLSTNDLTWQAKVVAAATAAATEESPRWGSRSDSNFRDLFSPLTSITSELLSIYTSDK